MNWRSIEGTGATMVDGIKGGNDLVGWRRSWARGTLLGLAVGDAFGTTLEFQSCSAPGFPQLATGPHVDMTGGGPFSVEAGQVTDDTQMATCLAASLTAHKRFHPTDVAQRYVEWSKHAFDIGNLTRASLSMIARGVSIGEASRRAWIQSEKRTAGNGSLMRVAPIAVAFPKDAIARRLSALADSAITHFDPRCRIACAAFCAAIGEAGAGRTLSSQMHAAAKAEVDEATTALIALVPTDGRAVEAARDAIHADLDLALRDDPELYGPEVHIHHQQGFVRVAFRLAFWELMHAPTFETALVDVVNRGGDADTNGAITGALLGAQNGEGVIRQDWGTRVMDALMTGPASPLRDDYHPRRMMELVSNVS